MDHVEPMDLDSIESAFDNKENTYQHNNALTTITHNNRVSSIERGYEELDVSELGMKLRYSVTPISSPMSKSFTANCLDNRNISSVEDAIIINNQNLTRSLNSSMINSDSILKSPKSLPLQSLPTDQFKDLNRNASVRRSLDGAKNNITVTINTPLDTDDNLSLPSTSSSLAHTPEATTPTKEIPKQDGGSPILRGLKSVLSMFRSSQSPIPPYDDTNKKNTDASLSESQVTDIKTQTVLVSTPIRSKNSPLKSGSPLKDSVVFKDDLERELQWKDDSEIIFKDEKIPIQKLFLQALPYDLKSVNKLTNENINTTVEYMDISFNEPPDEPLKSDAMNHTNHTVDSDSEFQDCETTFTKTEGDAIENKTVNISTSHSQGNINMSIVENEYTEVKLEESSVTSQPQAELKANQSINIQSVENNFAHSQQVPKDVNTYETMNIETELSEEILQDIVENTQNVNTSQLNAKEDISSQLSCDKTNETIFSSEQESIENKKSEQILVENQCDILSKGTKINSNTGSDPLPSPYNINNINESCTGNEDANMLLTGKECKEVKLDQIELNLNQTINLFENDIVHVQSIQEGMKLSETIEIDIQNIVENIQYNNTIDNNIEQDMLLKMSIDKTLMAISTTDLDIEKNKCEQTIAKNENDISKDITEIGCNTNIEINPLNSVSNIQTNKVVDNVCELHHEVLSNNEVLLKTIDMNQAKELVNNPDSIDETIRKLDDRNEKNVYENNEEIKSELLNAGLIDHEAIHFKCHENPKFGDEIKDNNKNLGSDEVYAASIDSTMNINIKQEDVNVSMKEEALLNNNKSEVIDQSKIVCTHIETSKNNIDLKMTNTCEKQDILSQIVKPTTINTLMTQQDNLKEAEIMPHDHSAEPTLLDVMDVNLKNMENDILSQMDTSVLNSKPSDIPLPFDDDAIPNIINEISDIIDEKNKNKKILDVNSTKVTTTNVDDFRVPQRNIITNDVNNISEITVVTSDAVVERKQDLILSIEAKVDSSIKQNIENCLYNDLGDAYERLKQPNNLSKEVDSDGLGRDNEIITNSENFNCEGKEHNGFNDDVMEKSDQDNVSSHSNAKTTNFVNKEAIINNSSISIDQVSISATTKNADELVTDMEVQSINKCSELEDQIPFDTKCNMAITPPSSPKIISKGYNFNFDEIDDPFATKTNIRQSPTPESPCNEKLMAVDDSKKPKCNTFKKTNQNRRKSQPVLRKQTVSKKPFNSTIHGSVTLMKEENKDILETLPCFLNNDLRKEYNETNKNDDVENALENTRDALEPNINKKKMDISIEEQTTLIQNDECNERSNEIDRTCIEISRKNVFNIPEIDDKNFNPFASRSKICVSPTPTNTTIVHDISSNQDICNNTHNITSNIEKHGNITEKNDYSEISNITSSSKHTDETNDIVKQIHTEDEDTIEGPFLDAEALAELEQDANILPESEKDNMIDFDDFPSQINEDNTDNAEIFIDAEAFEFLLNQNKSNMVVDSGKESLFLKFDPLFASRVSSDGILAALNKVPKRVSTPKKTKQKVDNILLIDNLNAGTSSNVTSSIVNEEDINVNVSKPTMIVNPAVNPIISPRKAVTPPKINRQSLTFTSPAMAVIDRLLSISGNGNSSFLNHDTAMQRASAEQHQTDLALIQLREMLAEKELHVQTLRSESKELKDRLSVMESQVRSLETESQERLRKVTGLNNKLCEATKVNQTMSAVVEEYERTIASLVAELEQDKRRNAEERMKLIRDRDEQTAHLASMEVSFSDLHSKYEKSKQIIMSLKANEDAYKKSVTEFEDSLEKMQNNYELLKQHATSKLNHTNTELEKINRAHEAEVLKLNAMIKRKDMHITSLEETLAQKTKANEELTAICDELINKVG